MMGHSTDEELLKAYSESRSAQAIALLIDRHIDFVYTIALRQVRDPATADDVTQAVFLVLAAKPASAAGRPLAGWLFKTTRLCGRSALRSESRRRRYEQAAARSEAAVNESDSERLNGLTAQIDDGLAKLRSSDRELILMRFMQNRHWSDVARSLITEVTARKRLSRAVDRLRSGLLGSPGLTSDTGRLFSVSPASLQTLAVVKAAVMSKAIAPSAAALSAKAIRSRSWVGVKLAAAVLPVSVAVMVAVVARNHGHRGPANRRPQAVAVVLTEPGPPHGPEAWVPLPIPEATENSPGRLVEVAERLNDNGAPVKTSVPLSRDLNVVSMAANDPHSIPRFVLPATQIPLADVFSSLSRQTDVRFLPNFLQNTMVAESGQPRSFWEVVADASGQAKLKPVGFTADPGKMVYFQPIAPSARPKITAGPWGLIQLASVEKVTRIVSPPWVFRESFSATGSFQPDPAVATAVVYPASVWAEDRWHESAGGLAIVGERSAAQLSIDLPLSLTQDRQIADLKLRLPLKLVHRTRTVKLTLKPGQNSAIAIDGLVVQFFDLKQGPDQFSFSYGFIRQPGQSAKRFTQLTEEYQAWMNRLEVLLPDGQVVQSVGGSGRSQPGEFAVTELQWSGATAVGSIALQWTVPAVVQSVSYEFGFHAVELP